MQKKLAKKFSSHNSHMLSKQKHTGQTKRSPFFKPRGKSVQKITATIFIGSKVCRKSPQPFSLVQKCAENHRNHFDWFRNYLIFFDWFRNYSLNTFSVAVIFCTHLWPNAHRFACILARVCRWGTSAIMMWRNTTTEDFSN